MNTETHRAHDAAAATGCRRLLAPIISVVALLLALVALAPAVAEAASSDLEITKTADNTSYAPGDQITYTLRVDNHGPDASGATATDVLPAGVTFVSSGPGCSYAPGPRTVTCNYNPIAPGGFATQSFIVSVDIGYLGPPAPPNLTPHVHQLITDKVEKHIDLNPGETRYETLSCPGYVPIMTDGTVLVQHVDQGTGTIADVEVAMARPSPVGTDTYEFTIINHATGHAQVKLFGVCLSNTTNTVLGHSHSIQFVPSSGVPTYGDTNFGTGGYHEAFGGTAACPPGTQPTSPGFWFHQSNGRVVKSEQVQNPDGSSYWVFGFVLDYPGTVQVSVRCMKTSLGGPGNAGHTHDLQLKEIFRNVLVPPGTSVHRLDCGTYASDAKGITATYDFDSQMTLAGTTPQPIIRDFTFFNPSAGPLGAHIDLICLRMHTGPAHSIHAPLTNTASVQGPNPDPDSSNDSDSVAVTVDANDPPGFAASLGLASAATLSTADDGTVTVKADCGKAAACTGTIALRAKIRRGHGSKNWAVVAGGPLNTAAGASQTLKLPLTPRGARKLGSWRNDRSVIAETTLAGAGEPVTHRLRLKRR